ncbi:unnamed protein product [Adineta steineri]|nr:unnamed protein product [Adineta steineri]CAF4076613.1 unnamed protein product [Adineta steineri]
MNNSTQMHIQLFLSDLDKIWSNASSYYTGQVTVSAPWIDPHVRGSYPCYTVGQYSVLHGYEKKRQMSIHFAGDYTSLTTHFAFMEGAASEGPRAALEIIGDYH